MKILQMSFTALLMGSFWASTNSEEEGEKIPKITIPPFQYALQQIEKNKKLAVPPMEETSEFKRQRALQTYEECKDKYPDLRPHNLTVDDIAPDIKIFTLEEAQISATFYRQSLYNTTFLLEKSIEESNLLRQDLVVCRKDIAQKIEAIKTTQPIFEEALVNERKNLELAELFKKRADENWEYFEKVRTLAVALQSEFSQAKEIISELRAEIAEKGELIAQLQRTTNSRLEYAVSEEERINGMVEMSYQSYLEIRDLANMGPYQSPEQRTTSNKRMKEKLYRDARNALKGGIDIPTVPSAEATVVFHAPTDPNVSLLTAQMLSNQRNLGMQQQREAMKKLPHPMPGMHVPQSR